MTWWFLPEPIKWWVSYFYHSFYIYKLAFYCRKELSLLHHVCVYVYLYVCVYIWLCVCVYFSIVSRVFSLFFFKKGSSTLFVFKDLLFIFGCGGSLLLHTDFSLVAESGGHSSSLQCVGFSLSWLLSWWCTGSGHTGSAAVAHGLSCSVGSGIFLGQGSNWCPLYCKADS